MKCADAKHLIHLDAGNDLRAEEELQLASHLEQCADCRVWQGGMTSAMNALLTLRDDSPMIGHAVGRSVWPALSREIKRRNLSPRIVRKFNLQVVALSVCSLSLAVVTMVQSLSSMRSDSDPSGFVPAQSISHSMWAQGSPYPSPHFENTFNDADSERTLILPHEAPVSMPQTF